MNIYIYKYWCTDCYFNHWLVLVIHKLQALSCYVYVCMCMYIFIKEPHIEHISLSDLLLHPFINVLSYIVFFLI